MIQAFTEISINTIQTNWFEIAAVGLAAMYSRGTIIPMFLLIYCVVFNLYQEFFVAQISSTYAMYQSGAATYELVMMAYNSFYVMGGLIFVSMAFVLAYVRPVRSKTGLFYCAALCIQSLLSISMFVNGLQVSDSSGNLVINFPQLDFIAIIHGFVNEKMIIITVITAWISVVLSRMAKS